MSPVAAAAMDRWWTLWSVLVVEPDAPAGPTPEDPASLRADVAARIGTDEHLWWLALAVLRANLPTPAEVLRFRRRAELDGPAAALASLRGGADVRRVRVVRRRVLVDVDHLARTTMITGIQRVAHETGRRWHRDHGVSFVVWTRDRTSMRLTTVGETARTLGRPVPPEDPGDPDDAVVVPWRCHWILPEIALEEERTGRLQAMARWARCATGVIGHDAIPMTTSETCPADVPGRFMNMLTAVRHMGRLWTNSRAARAEFEGWRTMVTGLGLPGPALHTGALPVEAAAPSEAALERVALTHTTPTVPMVLVVGSHEPRKNHVAVLTAAELLWRAGAEFTLVFVGGNTWKSETFEALQARLEALGRPITTARGLADDELWALYRLARFTVFPSVNEGFGLPVAESLASGTPVITTRFGSMAEIAEDGGALLVDPHDPEDLAAAMGRLLEEDALHARLVREARSRPRRTWDDYAAETWEFFVTGQSAG